MPTLTRIVIPAPYVFFTAKELVADEIEFEPDSMLVLVSTTSERQEFLIACDRIILQGQRNTISHISHRKLNGRHGTQGRNGDDARYLAGRLQGRPGTDGENGTDGSPGGSQHGPSLSLKVNDITGLGLTEFVFELPGLKGGNGGDGGNGGNGGHGEDGSDADLDDEGYCAAPSGPGGSGGAGGGGGMGGSAGDGGDGGTIHIECPQLTREAIEREIQSGTVSVVVVAGPLGDPGKGGRKGLGGRGGAPGIRLADCALIWPEYQETRGVDGANGADGAPSQDGHSGSLFFGP